jgi:hypothetical protein
MNTDLTSLTNGIIKSNLTTTLAYSYFSDRINAIGTSEKEI